MTTAERDIAEALADVQDWSVRPVESFPPFPYGEPIQNPPQLKAYGPVTKENVHAGVRLLSMYFGERWRAASKTWASLPTDVRQRVLLQAQVMRCERLLAEMEAWLRDAEVD